MTIREALRWAEDKQRIMTSTYRYQFTESDIWQNKICIEALEKQIPKKPNMIKNMGTTYWNCPACSSLVADSVIGVKYLHYCGACGQAIDWWK